MTSASQRRPIRFHCTLTVTILLCAAARSAQAQVPLDVLHHFVGGTDGAVPFSTLIQASDGNFYGTTFRGGPDALGTVFRMTPEGVVTVLHAFTPTEDGVTPAASLLQAADGRLYGAAAFSPESFDGTLFSMTLDGAFTTLHRFAGSSDGAVPTAAPIQARDGNFYGTTYYSNNGINAGGTVYKMTQGGAVSVLHTFVYPDEGSPTDVSLVEATDGNFYGTAQSGGAFNTGTAFRLTPVGVVTVLHSFNGPDGVMPQAALIQAPDGNFYGTTGAGGYNAGSFGAGTVFRMTPDGTVTPLHVFTGGVDGSSPLAALILATDGNFYGTTSAGGEFNRGTVFWLTPDGVLTVLHSFAGSPNDGADPIGGLVQGSDGNLYGMTSHGGLQGKGIAYRLDIATCRDALTLGYSGGTLTIGFTLETSVPAIWSTWITSGSNSANLWSIAIPAVSPAASFTIPFTGVPPGGVLGVLTTISRPSGALCSDFQQVDTGRP